MDQSGRSLSATLVALALASSATYPAEASSPANTGLFASADGAETAYLNPAGMVRLERSATLQAWAEPFVPLRVPLIFNLRRDSYERAQVTSNTYYDWLIDRAHLLVPAQTYVANFLGTFKKFPLRQKAASFSLDQVMETLSGAGGSK